MMTNTQINKVYREVFGKNAPVNVLTQFKNVEDEETLKALLAIQKATDAKNTSAETQEQVETETTTTKSESKEQQGPSEEAKAIDNEKVLTEDEVTIIYENYLGRTPTKDEIAAQTGNTKQSIIYGALNNEDENNPDRIAAEASGWEKPGKGSPNFFEAGGGLSEIVSVALPVAGAIVGGPIGLAIGMEMSANLPWVKEGWKETTKDTSELTGIKEIGENPRTTAHIIAASSVAYGATGPGGMTSWTKPAAVDLTSEASLSTIPNYEPGVFAGSATPSSAPAAEGAIAGVESVPLSSTENAVAGNMMRGLLTEGAGATATSSMSFADKLILGSIGTQLVTGPAAAYLQYQGQKESIAMQKDALEKSYNTQMAALEQAKEEEEEGDFDPDKAVAYYTPGSIK